MYFSLTRCLVVLSAFLVLAEARQYYNSRLFKLKKKKHFTEKKPVIPRGVNYDRNKGRFPGIPHGPVHQGYPVVKGGVPHHVQQKYPVTKGGFHPGRNGGVFHDGFHQFDTLGGRPGFKGGVSHGNVHPKHLGKGGMTPVIKDKHDGIFPVDGGILHPEIPNPVNNGVKFPVNPVIKDKHDGIFPVDGGILHPVIPNPVNNGVKFPVNPVIKDKHDGIFPVDGGILHPVIPNPVNNGVKFPVNPVIKDKQDGIFPADGGILHPVIPNPVNNGVKFPINPVIKDKHDGIFPADGGILHPVIPNPVNNGVKFPDPVIDGGIKPIINDGKRPGIIDNLNPGFIDEINPGIDGPNIGVIGVVNPKVVDPIGPVPKVDINPGAIGGINNEGFLDPINSGVVDKVNPGFIDGPSPPGGVGFGPGNFDGGVVGSNWRGDIGPDFVSDPRRNVGFNGGNNFRGNFGRNFGPSFDTSFTNGGDFLPGGDPRVEGNFGLPPGVDRGNFGNPFTRNEFPLGSGNNFPGNPGSRGFLESERGPFRDFLRDIGGSLMNRFSGTGGQGSSGGGFPSRFPGNFEGSRNSNSQWSV